MENILKKYMEPEVSQEEKQENPLEELVEKTKYHVFKGTDRVVCCLYLKKGNSIIAVSDAPVEEDFNEEVGKSIARDRAMDQLAKMEDYAVGQESLDKVHEFIDKNPDVLTKKSKVKDKDVDRGEKELGIAFDDDYRDYLLSYGAISYKSMELYGLGVPEDSHLNVVKATKDPLEPLDNLPSDSVMLEDIGESNVVIYKMKDGVYQLSPKKKKKIFSSLEEYILTRFKEVEED